MKQWLSPVKDGIITSSFGYRVNPVLDVEELHNGVDIAVIKGTDAIAVEQGKVNEVGVSQTYGNFLKYTTSDGYMVMYAHLSEVLVNNGDSIEKGQTIALTGDTGLVTGAHIHYSVFLNGNAVDPMSLNFVALN